MFTKLAIFAAALIVVGPVFASTAGSSGGGSSAPASAGASPSVSSGGGGHSGGGGGSHGGGGGLAARGAAASTHGGSFGAAAANDGNARSWHAGASHGAKPTAGQHIAMEHAPAKMAGTDRHHHPPRFHRREPRWGDTFPTCVTIPGPLLNPWNNCGYSPSKSTPGNGTNRRS